MDQKPGPKMDPRMQGFLQALGVNRRMTLRDAAEWCIAMAMADPENEEHLPPGRPLPVEELAREHRLRRYGEVAATREALEKGTSPPAPEPQQAVPPPKVEAPKKPEAPRNENAHGYIGTRPSRLVLGGAESEVTTWRHVYCAVAEALIVEGKGAEIPDSFCKENEQNAKRVSRLSDGRWLYTNLTADQVVPRIRLLATALGKSLVVSYEQDGSPKSLTV